MLYMQIFEPCSILLKMFCNTFANVLAQNIFKTFLEVVTYKIRHKNILKTFLEVVTCEIKQSNILQYFAFFYFTRNHAL